MAQFYTDFSEYPIGVQPDGWTKRLYSAYSTWKIEADAAATGGKVLRHTATSGSNPTALSWDAIGNHVDVELLAKMRTSYTVSRQNNLCARGGESCYRGSLFSSDLRIDIATNNDEDILDREGFYWGANIWYWMRFRVQGSALRVRVWQDGQEEPTSWTLGITDTTLTGAGWVGLGAQYFNGQRDFDVFAVGTAGDPAPSEPVAVPGGFFFGANF